LAQIIGAGVCVGAAAGGAVDWGVLIANPHVSHMIFTGPEPVVTWLALSGALASLCAVGAALSGVVISLSCEEPKCDRPRAGS